MDMSIGSDSCMLVEEKENQGLYRNKEDLKKKKKSSYNAILKIFFMIYCVKWIICKVTYKQYTNTVSQKWIIEELPLVINIIFIITLPQLLL